MDITLKKGKTKGHILFDPALGMARETSLLQEVDMKMEYVVQTGPSLFMGKKQTATSQVRNTTSLKLIEIKPLVPKGEAK